jgi:hypothetical protein
MSAKASFTVVYDGFALREHAIDVRDLAPALLSFGQLFDEANKVLNGDKSSIKLCVKAYEVGSFGVYLELTQSLLSQVSSFLNSDPVVSIINLKELIIGVGAGGIGIFAFIKKTKGKTLNNITDLKNGLVKIEIGNEAFEIPKELLKLYQDSRIRLATEAILKPLKTEGIETFQIKDENNILETITKDEQEYFAAPEEPGQKVEAFYNKQLLWWYQIRFDSKSDSGDKAVIENIFKKPIKVIFKDEVIKQNMINTIGFAKPWQKLAYIVDVEVLFLNEKPKTYKILDFYPEYTFDPDEED